MILFKKDWKNYPSAIADYNTKNKSWVRLAAVYKQMGIENYNFHLALHNPLLVGVDPFDKNLTNDMIIMITEEAFSNPWYVLRELIRIPPLAGPDPVMLSANRGNISLFWLFFNHITTMLIQPRQTGKSVSTDSLMVTLLGILTLNTDINLLTKDDDLRVKNVNRIKSLLNLLPYYLNLRTKKDTFNTEKITINRLGNTYHTNVAQPSPRAALNLGRGMTIAINQIDEIAFVKNISVTLPAMLAAGGVNVA
jgi:L-rhamnose mutarotase